MLACRWIGFKMAWPKRSAVGENAKNIVRRMLPWIFDPFKNR